MTTESTHNPGSAIVIIGGGMGLALAVLCVALAGTDQQGTEIGLRATAALAFPFLAGAYAAPALAVLWPGRFAAWLLARRRWLGLAFAAVFAVHLALIARLLSLPPEPPPTAFGLALGFVAYVLLAGMVLASFRGFAAKMGAARVRLLRRVGEQWVFAVFTLTLLNGAINQTALWLPPLAIALGLYAARFAAWWRGRTLKPAI
jgi:DMSO/TMAO reductase YedYZ heme-binding membrane subunit